MSLLRVVSGSICYNLRSKCAIGDIIILKKSFDEIEDSLFYKQSISFE